MKRYLSITRVIVCVSVLIAAAVIFKLPSTLQATQQDRTITIENQTVSLEVVSSRIDSSHPGQEYFEMVLKNIGRKPIRSYSVRISSTGHLEAGFDSAPELFLPDTTKTFRTPTSSIAPPQTLGEQRKIVIDLVYFSDDSAEGNWGLAGRQKERYEGMALAFRGARAKVQILSDAASLDPSALTLASDQIGQAPIPGGLTESQRVGFQEGIQNIQSLLNLARQNHEQAPTSDEGRELTRQYNKRALKQFLAHGDADLTRRIEGGHPLFTRTQGGIK